jgi:hypothetical protein
MHRRQSFVGLLVLGAVMSLGLVARAQDAPPATETQPAETTTTPAPADTAKKAVSAEKAKLLLDLDRPLAPIDVVGTLPRVTGGHVSPWDLIPLDLSGAVAGLGYATEKRFSTTGELLSFAGRTFIRSTDAKTGVRVVEVPGTFKTPFALYMSAPKVVDRQVFPRVYRLNSEVPQLLYSYLEALADETASPIGVLGWLEMPDVEGLALKRAPIDGESLMGSKKDDYVETVRAQNAHVAFFAIVVPTKCALGRSSLNAYALTPDAFDFVPDETVPAATLVHVHGALVDQSAPNDYDTSPLLMKGLQRVTVKDILHLQGATTVKSGVAMVYRLQYVGTR